MAEMSPTLGGVISSKGDYVFGDGFTVTRRTRPGLSRRADVNYEIDENASEDYVNFIEERICKLPHLLDTAKHMYDNRQKLGNSYLEIVLTSVAGKRYVKLVSHDAETVMLENTPEKNTALVAEWSTRWLTRHEPRKTGVYPFFYEDDLGNFRSVIHIREPQANRPHYALQPWHEAYYFVRNEIQLGYYTTNEYDEMFMGQVFIETEGDDRNGDQVSAFSEFDFHLKQSFTNQGPKSKRKRVLHRQRLTGTAKTEVHEFKGNTNEKYHMGTMTIAEQQIFKVTKWHPILMNSVAGRLGASGEFSEILKAKYPTVILPEQTTYLMNPINEALKVCEEWMGVTGFEDLNLGLPDISKHLDMLDPKTSSTAQTNQDAS